MNLTSIHRDAVLIPVSFSGLWIWHFFELWFRSQMRLEFFFNSVLTPRLRISICCLCRPIKNKNKHAHTHTHKGVEVNKKKLKKKRKRFFKNFGCPRSFGWLGNLWQVCAFLNGLFEEVHLLLRYLSRYLMLSCWRYYRINWNNGWKLEYLCSQVPSCSIFL